MTDWKAFDEQHGHKSYSAKFDLLGPWRRWRERKRAEKKRQLIAHQEAYARACKAEEHRKAELAHKAKRNLEKQIQETRRMAEEIGRK